MAATYHLDLGTLPDSLLVDLVADGDADAFAMIVHRYGVRMRSVAFRYTRNSTDADDVVQESLVRAWQQINDLKNPDALSSWLLQLTARKAIDMVRRRRNHAQLDEGMDTASHKPTPDQHALHRARLDDLDRALLKLPLNQARAWVLRYGAQMSYFEIAQALKISTATVRGRLARARQSLLQQMKGWEHVN